MKLPLSWLNDYMDFKVPVKEFCDSITMTGTKVESYEEIGGGFSGVVLGRLTEVAPHPDSDHLQICITQIAPGETVQILTGAPNVFTGAIVAVATIGAELPGGITIKKTKMRGLESFGMLCSHDELGLAFEDVPGAAENGVIIFPEDFTDAPMGTDIRDILELRETVVDFEITPNRPDCLSINGLARETAATFSLPFSIPEVSVKGAGGNISDHIRITVKAPDLCPRYTARMVRNIKIGPSPKWMKRRLEACGVRSINNIVDITNYVMLEYGQPMHAFDMRYLHGGEIIVRRAHEGETITTLDEQERKLTPNMLVIADSERAVALAGVMGGLNSEIMDDTVDVLFESANFERTSVRRAAMSVGLRTESSGRFEKGLDPENTVPAVNRACQLIEMLGCGEVVDGIIDIDHHTPMERVIPFDPEWTNRFLGVHVTEEKMREDLTRLGFIFTDGGICVPSFRADVEAKVDIAEEVVRMYGYNKIESTPLRGETSVGRRNPRQLLEKNLSEWMVAMGYYEQLTYSFTSPKSMEKAGEDTKNAIRIANPLGEETSMMRTGLMSGILECLATNYNNRNKEARLFELGTVYLPKQLPLTELPTEKTSLVFGAYGGDVDFFSLKGIVETIFSQLGIQNAQFKAVSDRNAFHPGKTAAILIGNEEIGVIGEVHPDTLEAFEIGARTYVAHLSVTALLAHGTFERTYRKIGRFPAVTRDIAVIVDKDLPVGQLFDAIKKYGGKLLEELTLFDIYQGAQIPHGKKSVAYSASFRSPDHTLTDEEVNKVFQKILRGLNHDTGAELR